MKYYAIRVNSIIFYALQVVLLYEVDVIFDVYQIKLLYYIILFLRDYDGINESV